MSLLYKEKQFISIRGFLGEKVSKGSAVYLNVDRKFYNADASNSSKLPAVGIAKEGGEQGNEVEIILTGKVLDVNRESDLTVGKKVYVSSSTPGKLTTTPPTSGNYHQIIGVAISATDVILDVNLDCLKIV